MPTDIIMPQMGESIVEGTITKWLKKPGDKVQRDEPLFEISTDKVDAEIPAPASGVLQEIKVTEGTTVGVNTVVGTISVDGEAAAAPPKAVPTPAPQAKEDKKEEKKPVTAPTTAASAQPSQESSDDEEARSSPLVRKIAREHGVS
ncbi:MAG: biotin/lipoyl-containing protein, partial [Terriglobales bacterium]